MIIETAKERPWVVLIHGLGVTEKVWLSPLEEKVFLLSFRYLFKDERNVVPFAERCKPCFNIATWTQDRSAGVDEAARELDALVRVLPGKTIFLIAHSRGGLVARRAIQNHGLRPKALICLSSPHYGSRFADTVVRHGKILSFLFPALRESLPLIEELSPGASLILDMNCPEKTALEAGVPHYDIAGNSTAYFTIRLGSLEGGLPVFRVMSFLDHYLGKIGIEEWRHGEGDGFVSLKSARSPLSDDNMFFQAAVNHLNILIDNKVWDIVKSIVAKHCS